MRKSVRSIGRVAAAWLHVDAAVWFAQSRTCKVKLERACERAINVLLELIETKAELLQVSGSPMSSLHLGQLRCTGGMRCGEGRDLDFGVSGKYTSVLSRLLRTFSGSTPPATSRLHTAKRCGTKMCVGITPAGVVCPLRVDGGFGRARSEGKVFSYCMCRLHVACPGAPTAYSLEPMSGFHDLDPGRIRWQAPNAFSPKTDQSSLRCGHSSARIDNADELLESFLDTFHDEPLMATTSGGFSCQNCKGCYALCICFRCRSSY